MSRSLKIVRQNFRISTEVSGRRFFEVMSRSPFQIRDYEDKRLLGSEAGDKNEDWSFATPLRKPNCFRIGTPFPLDASAGGVKAVGTRSTEIGFAFPSMGTRGPATLDWNRTPWALGFVPRTENTENDAMDIQQENPIRSSLFRNSEPESMIGDRICGKVSMERLSLDDRSISSVPTVVTLTQPIMKILDTDCLSNIEADIAKHSIHEDTRDQKLKEALIENEVNACTPILLVLSH